MQFMCHGIWEISNDYSCSLLIFSIYGNNLSALWRWIPLLIAAMRSNEKTDIRKGDYYFIICLPVFFFLFVLFCFVFFLLLLSLSLLLLLLLLLLLYIFLFFVWLVWQLFSPFIDFFIIYSLRRRKWMWTVQQRRMQPWLYQYSRGFLLQMPNRFSVEQKGDLRG